MNGSYDPIIVAISVLIAILASYTALDMAARVLVESGRRRAAWLIGGSFAMGIGIWSMHFVGMLAFRLPIPVAYDLPLTILSAAIAIFASGLALLVVSRGDTSPLMLATASVLAGLAISGMHYAGMAAMRMPADLGYEPLLLLLSIGIAIGAAWLALWLVFRLGVEAPGSGLQKLGGGVVLGLAIVGMHYTGMAAARLTPSPGWVPTSEEGILGTPDLIILVVIFAVAILTLALITAAADRKRRALEKRILESIIDAFVAVDRQWRVTYVNAEAERLLGRSRKTLIAGTLRDAFPEVMGPRLESECRRAVAEKETAHFEESDGTGDRWFEFRGLPTDDGLAVYFHEVTRRKRAEERALDFALEQARREEAEAASERVTQILESITDGFFALDQGWRFTYVNRNAEEFFGERRDDLLGHRIWDLFPVAENGAFHQQYRLALAQGVPMTLEAESDIAPGRWLEEHIYPSDGGLSIYSRDITERKDAQQAVRQSEERFRAFTEHSADIVTVLDPEGMIQYESPSAEKELGYKPEDLVGINAFSLVHPDDVAKVTEIFGRVLATPEALFSTELRFRHKDGRWCIMHAQGRNLLDHPAVRGIVVNSRQVTDERELEEKLRQSQKMEAVGRLAGGIAHDFNNLLTSILGHSRLLLEELDEDASLHEDAREIATAAERASNLTRQLLAFSRREIVQPRTLGINGVVSEMEGMLRRLISADLDLTVDLAADAASIRADRTQIQQVILNLAVNAADAVDDGGSIRISTGSVGLSEGRARGGETPTDLEPGSYTILTVEDTGHGMSEQTLERIFEPFFTTKKQGTGLGLATVYAIVDQSGGSIDVRSRPGEGAVFTIYFPRLEVDPDGGEHAGEPLLAPSSEQSPVTVLLVEDEPGVRTIARKVLMRHGYHVLEAENGRIALDLARDHTGPIELVLTDIVMPVMGGRELVERLREVRPETTPVYMSGYTPDEVVKQGISRDQTAFLEKPFGPRALLSKLDEVLRVRPGR